MLYYSGRTLGAINGDEATRGLGSSVSLRRHARRRGAARRARLVGRPRKARRPDCSQLEHCRRKHNPNETLHHLRIHILSVPHGWSDCKCMSISAAEPPPRAGVGAGLRLALAPFCRAQILFSELPSDCALTSDTQRCDVRHNVDRRCHGRLAWRLSSRVAEHRAAATFPRRG